MASKALEDFKVAGQRILRWGHEGQADYGQAGKVLFRRRYQYTVINSSPDSGWGADRATWTANAIAKLERLSEMVNADTTDADVAAALAEVGFLDRARYAEMSQLRRRIERWLMGGPEYGPAGEVVFKARWTATLLEASGVYGDGARDDAIDTLASLDHSIRLGSTDEVVRAGLADMGLLDGAN